MLVSLIEQYLESHKRLVVPQLGAFLVSENPYGVVFSELLRRDDGVLQGLLVARGMSEVAARGEIDRLVYEVRHAIEAGECYYLSDFGEFKPGKNGTIHFEYHPRLSVVPESPIEIVPDLIEKVRPEPRPTTPKRADVVEPRPIEPQQPVWHETADEDPDEEEQIDEVSEEELLSGVETAEPSTDEAELMEEFFDEPQQRTAPRRKARPQKQQKPDYFMWVAIAAGVIALLAIAFGLYNNLTGGEEYDEVTELYEPLIETAAQSDPYGELNE